MSIEPYGKADVMADTLPDTAIAAWEDDPVAAILEGQPPMNQPVHRAEPDFDPPGLPVGIAGPQPPPDIYKVGTEDFRYWALADALARAAGYWSGRVPTGTTWQPDNGTRLVAVPDGGVDLNAYYNRNGLHFFHGSVRGTTVYSGESPDVVCHELGHAVLDAVKPQLWDAASIEVAAFHESFADCSAILSNLQVPSLRDAVLAETRGDGVAAVPPGRRPRLGDPAADPRRRGLRLPAQRGQLVVLPGAGVAATASAGHGAFVRTAQLLTGVHGRFLPGAWRHVRPPAAAQL